MFHILDTRYFGDGVFKMWILLSRKKYLFYKLHFTKFKPLDILKRNTTLINSSFTSLKMQFATSPLPFDAFRTDQILVDDHLLPGF